MSRKTNAILALTLLDLDYQNCFSNKTSRQYIGMHFMIPAGWNEDGGSHSRLLTSSETTEA